MERRQIEIEAYEVRERPGECYRAKIVQKSEDVSGVDSLHVCLPPRANTEGVWEGHLHEFAEAHDSLPLCCPVDGSVLILNRWRSENLLGIGRVGK